MSKMRLDNEGDRRLLLAVIDQAQFKGEITEYVSDLKKRIASAEIAPLPPTPPGRKK